MIRRRLLMQMISNTSTVYPTTLQNTQINYSSHEVRPDGSGRCTAVFEVQSGQTYTVYKTQTEDTFRIGFSAELYSETNIVLTGFANLSRTLKEYTFTVPRGMNYFYIFKGTYAEKIVKQ